ncbi:MAG: proline--tRNA ligase [Spirochaetaceae bacterium]|nr:proline--tRNA ligase [Spirochaetaceae bacterium]
MHFTKTFIPTLREVPADAVIASHRLMFRAGMIRKLANGLFAYLPLGLRSFRKVEQIIRDEQNAAGALEIKPPVLCPGDLWKESGRWDMMGDTLLRLKNRTGMEMIVSPTAEESFIALVRDELFSYRQLPLILYQINTKYRDELRPRYGVMRGREFVMKDAYSFDADAESLDKSYRAMGKAYRRTFNRCGLTTIIVKADSGAIGGDFSEEFMVESSIGDNSLILCKACDYAANVERALCKPDFEAPASIEEAVKHAAAVPSIEKFETPNVKTIDDLCAFFKTDDSKFIKTLIYKAVNVELDLSQAPGGKNLLKRKIAADLPEVYPEVFVAVAIRGNIEVNEVKLTSLLKASEVALADEKDVVRLTHAPLGFAGPIGLDIPVIADTTVTAMTDAVCGALAADMHYAHACYGRDFTPWLVADVRVVKAGNTCSKCGDELYEKKGNELGHIFKLDYKYSKPMNLHYSDENGKRQIPLMGCYGIGVDRTLASVIEEYNDDKGIVWPMSVAPYQVIIIPVVYEGALKQAADRLEAQLEAQGIEVLLDDRAERVGVKFNDADLIGIPYRVVISEKGLAETTPSVEVKRRGKDDVTLYPVDTVATVLVDKVKEELAALNG